MHRPKDQTIATSTEDEPMTSFRVEAIEDNQAQNYMYIWDQDLIIGSLLYIADSNTRKGHVRVMGSMLPGSSAIVVLLALLVLVIFHHM